MARAGWAVGLYGRYDEFPAATDLHTRYSVLPALDEVSQGKLNRLSPIPGTVELVTRVVFHANVMHLDSSTGHRLGAVAHHQVLDEEFVRSGTVGKINLRFGCHGQ